MDSKQTIIDENLMKSFQDKIISLRRTIHQNPEIALKEYKTSQLIIENLKEAGFDEIYTEIASTGVVAVLRGELDESILLRGNQKIIYKHNFKADMDALPVKENTGLPFSSQIEGMHHACGHDGHCAMLLGTAFYIISLIKNGSLKLKRGIKFCFQPGEESANGAQKMCEATNYDLLNASPKVIYCFGQHIIAPLQYPKIGYHSGPFSAASERWDIKIKGKGGHSGQPETTIDALQVGVQICNALYQIRGRNVNQMEPCAVSIGVFKAGDNAPNVICDSAYIMGSVRTKKLQERERIFKQINQICDGAALTHGCQVDFTYISGYRAVMNSEQMENQVTNLLNRLFEKENITIHDIQLGGEDFYEFSGIVRPSTFIIIGGGSKEKQGLVHHSPKFDFDERCLQLGLKIFLGIIEEYALI